VPTPPRSSAPADEYDATARYYDRFVEPLVRPARRALVRWVEEHQPSRVLDLGCGTGSQIRHLLPRAGVWGLDLSPGMLAQAQRQAPGRCLQADATRVPFASGSFDLVYCQLALHEKPRAVVDAVLAEARRLLLPSGRLIVVDFARPAARGPLVGFFGLGVRFIEWRVGGEHYRCYREWMERGGLASILAAGGWELESSQPFYRGNLLLNCYR